MGQGGDVKDELKTYTRTASVSWLGNRQHKGAITTPGAGLNEIGFAFGPDSKRGATNSPELIAAAHAGSFSISLANELGIAGFCPEKIDTTATVTMEGAAAGWRMTQIHLDVVAAVPRVLQCDFVDAALRAKANCPISQLVSANISMFARLNRRGAAARLLPHHPVIPKPGPARKNKSTRSRSRR